MNRAEWFPGRAAGARSSSDAETAPEPIFLHGPNAANKDLKSFFADAQKEILSEEAKLLSDSVLLFNAKFWPDYLGSVALCADQTKHFQIRPEKRWPKAPKDASER